MARVFLTGAGGLLGSVLRPHLQAAGHEVCVAPGRPAPGQPLDLTREADMWQLLDAARPDVIVNLAALTNVDQCERLPEEAYRINAGMVLHLTRWIEVRAASTHLIQISTDQLYDGPGPHVEDVVCPTNFYAWSKCLADEYVGRVAGTSLRTNFFGRSRTPGRQSFSDWIVNSIRGQQPISVFADVLFSPLSLGTLTACIETAVRKRLAGTFNLGSRAGMSKADFAFSLAAALGLSTASLTVSSIAAVPLVARRPRDMRMQSERFQTIFGVSLPELGAEIDQVAGDYRNETL